MQAISMKLTTISGCEKNVTIPSAEALSFWTALRMHFGRSPILTPRELPKLHAIAGHWRKEHKNEHNPFDYLIEQIDDCQRLMVQPNDEAQ